MGIEYDIVLLLVLLYALLDLLFSNTFASVLVAYAADRSVLRRIRAHVSGLCAPERSLPHERTSGSATCR